MQQSCEWKLYVTTFPVFEVKLRQILNLQHKTSKTNYRRTSNFDLKSIWLFKKKITASGRAINFSGGSHLFVNYSMTQVSCVIQRFVILESSFIEFIFVLYLNCLNSSLESSTKREENSCFHFNHSLLSTLAYCLNDVSNATEVWGWKAISQWSFMTGKGRKNEWMKVDFSIEQKKRIKIKTTQENEKKNKCWLIPFRVSILSHFLLCKLTTTRQFINKNSFLFLWFRFPQNAKRICLRASESNRHKFDI